LTLPYQGDVGATYTFMSEFGRNGKLRYCRQQWQQSLQKLLKGGRKRRLRGIGIRTQLLADASRIVFQVIMNDGHVPC
jgi:hypothetical protein